MAENWEKIEEKFRRRPPSANLTFADAKKLLRAYGFEARQPSGGSSHYVFEQKEYLQTNIRVTLKKRKLNPMYVFNVCKAIDKVIEYHEEQKRE